MDTQIRTGGCQCGAVRYEVRGEPLKSGLCHCTDCRKITGSVFLAFADWHRHQFTVSGAFETYIGRSFCPKCGSRLFNLTDTAAEIYIGTMDDAPNAIAPQFEEWCIRREPWLPTLPGTPMYPREP